VNIFLLALETTGRPRIAIPVWLGLAFSSPLVTYTYLIFTELPTGLLLIYVFRRLELGWAANSRWRLLLIGTCIGLIPWLAWRCTLISGSLAVLVLIQWWRSRPPGARGTTGRRADAGGDGGRGRARGAAGRTFRGLHLLDSRPASDSAVQTLMT